MEQIETQASDLRYLSQAPVTNVPYETPRPPHRQGSSCSADYNGENSALAGDEDSPANSNKRKPTDPAGGKQTRSKRNRYISIACNECKRRKIKCNGETPCQRCGHLNLECLYAPNCCSNSFKESDDFKKITAQLSRLQDEVSRLNQTVSSMRPGETRLGAPAPPSTLAPSPQPSTISGLGSGPGSGFSRPETVVNSGKGVLEGPTSTAFSLDLADATIANMGWRAGDDADEPESLPASTTTSPPLVDGADPILEFDQDEMVRLCRVHEDEFGIMYPIVDMPRVVAHAKSITPLLDAARRQRSVQPINDDATLLLKTVMCAGLASEGFGHSDKAARLYDSMDAVVNRKLMVDTCDTANLPLLALVAGYRFLSCDEVLAWRVLGQVVRLCIELGVHQRRGLDRIQNEADRRQTLHTFWSAYVLERRWAFGLGLSFAVSDDEIDPQLPMPDQYPYLVAMIGFSKICAKVQRQVSHFGPVLARELCREEIENLDGEILAWYNTIPEEIRMHNWVEEEKRMSSSPSRDLRRLRVWTCLRLNQIRIWLHIPILHSATSIMSNLGQAQRVVNIAKDTIKYLTYLDKATDLYRGTFHHQFLAASISVVFLACVHAPVPFAGLCRDEIYMGLRLVEALSTKSSVSRRVWRAVQSLKDIAPRLGLDPEEDPHSTAALGMVGLSRGMMPASAGQTPYQDASMPSHQPLRGHPYDGGAGGGSAGRFGGEFSRIFENYVGLNGGHDELASHAMTDMSSPDPHNVVYQPDASMIAQMRGVF